jgi:hypothetical protein
VSHAVEKGELLLAGALADPADAAVLVFRADSAETAERFAQDDPYVAEGLVTNWRVRRWNVVTGDLDVSPESSSGQAPGRSRRRRHPPGSGAG